MKLTIIIPCYNAEPYINELLDCLDKQITPEIEVIIVDDGSQIPFQTKYTWAQVIRQKNGGASAARNTGLDNATGEYIAFIDADDLVSDKYIETALEKINEGFDYCYISWKTLPGGWACSVKLNSVEDTFPGFNLCVWNRIYKRTKIGNVRFNTKKKIAEDAEFIRKVKETGKKAFIPEYMYFYRSDTPDSLTKRFSDGKVQTRRVVYNIPHLKEDPKLLSEIKKLDKEAEVIVMTEKCDMPEIQRYAMVIKPTAIKGTELRGEPTRLYTQINPPIQADICIWTAVTQKIGGIETWIYNFCALMHKKYDIVVLYETMDDAQIDRLAPYAKVVRLGKEIICNTLIVSRITDKTPQNVTFGQKVQMVHACKMDPRWTVPDDNDYTVAVSRTVSDSFGISGKVIHNLIAPVKAEKALVLISATRLSTFEKGTARMGELARQMQNAGINFVWLCFSDKAPDCDLITWMSPRLDISPFMAIADYLVQLSDMEGFCYSIVEALSMKVPVITTPVDVLKEIGFTDGVDGYIVPFEGDMDVERFNRIPKVRYEYDNSGPMAKWEELLGEGHPSYHFDGKRMRIITTFRDSATGRTYRQGNVVYLQEELADRAQNAGYAREEK